jgi:enediyne polyketide synthase
MASSLLAVTTACSALAAGDCDAAVAGGVDLSLDPFELVGFAKTGALARERMRVYDVRSAGFWPGEGCGVAVLLRHDDAVAQGRRIYALIRGWGISSDGGGGITRPEAEGQLLALRRAYRKAGFDADSVAYFEGHGTGTPVGDATELRALARVRRDSGAHMPAAVSSVKAIFGHTKAAAGIAGLIKAAMALHTQVVPPATGCEEPHPEMGEGLVAPGAPALWPADAPLRASVSAFGFGGINSHVALEGATGARRQRLSDREMVLARTPQDAELFCFASQAQLDEAVALAPGLSFAEMTDLAASLAREAAPCEARAAVVAATPDELARKLATAKLRRTRPAPRIGFLFPGQGSQNNSAATEIAQPEIVRDSLRALREMATLGIEASVAIGHSLGELTALCWGGAIDQATALRIAGTRGRLMAALPGGAMASIAAGEEETARLIVGEALVIAGLNAPLRTVISGDQEAVDWAVERAREAGLHASRLPVSHAFHSPNVAAAGEPLAVALANETFHTLRRRVISTVTGAELGEDEDLRDLLRRQVTAPVRFWQAVEAASGDVDLWIEVGPGRVLSGLIAENTSTPAWPCESGASSRRATLEAVAAAFEMGAPVRVVAIFEGRFSRAFKGRRKFFANPCETAPLTEERIPVRTGIEHLEHESTPAGAAAPAIEVVRALVAERAELPLAAVRDDARLLADLHLNSIVVAQIVTEAARRLGLPSPYAPLEYAFASIGEVVEALKAARTVPARDEPVALPGVEAWVRPFQVSLVPRPLPAVRQPAAGDPWRFFGPREPAFESASLPARGGVILCLPPHPDARHIPVMLEAAQAAVRLRKPACFVLVQQGGGAASLAKTVHLEAREVAVAVVNVPAGDPRTAEWVIAEAGRGGARLHRDGVRQCGHAS